MACGCVSASTVAVVASCIALVCAIVSTATTGWSVTTFTIPVEGDISEKIVLGLFKSCAYVDGQAQPCTSVVGSSPIPTCDRTESERNVRFRVTQACSILASVFGALCLTLQLGRRVFGVLRSGAPLHFVGAAVAASAAVFSIVTFALFADSYGSWLNCGRSMCDTVCGASYASNCTCGMHYSFALGVAASFFYWVACGSALRAALTTRRDAQEGDGNGAYKEVPSSPWTPDHRKSIP